MFSKVNHKIYLLLLLFLLIALLAVVGCSSAEQSQSEQAESAVVAEEVADAEDTDGVEDVADGSNEEAVIDSPAIEPLNLGRDVDVQTVASVLDRDDVFLLDVRELSEHEAGHIAGNTLIPTGAVADRLTEIPKDKEVIIYCHSGARSNRVTQYLTQQGYTNVHNMLGGIVAWENAGLVVER